ncbi:NAD(P)/FAD-dependent oxidoreductase [Streptomyces sp. NRRL F-4428]|uniref:NAD(P)/FAD-dependent oxidoreductase n=1 Tax=Streptomyces sp. NRRL F-4428 TaxID=1609137 RepID=UPI0005ECC90B|nr:NAD(P)/FAD-dependent oxidoreductase [Streptomyces sp. NRRL F-4428]KJK53617.1 oxidoreductase [Streptomyces sp. NRRL F-4428]
MDVLVVGAGPAGLALATRLAQAGAGRVEVLEREQHAGGMPYHLHHGGFGRPPRPWLDGPAYARRWVRDAVDAGAAVRTGVTATGWAGPLCLETTGPAGLERITARAVVLATGARERPRSARLVPGSRPQGVMTTGELLRSVHQHALPVGRRAVVVGAEPVARHAAAVLRGSGTAVAAMLTEHPYAAAVPGVPLLTRTTVTELRGRGRLTGLAIRHRDGRTGLLGCDTVVFTGDWIPDHELARRGGVPLDPGTRGPRVDASFRTEAPGVFAVGNALHGIERAATAAREGAAAAAPVLAHLEGAPWPQPGPALEVRAPLLWVTPNRITGTAGRPLLLRSGAPLTAPVVTATQDGRTLWRRRLAGPASPSRSLRVPPRWTVRADRTGGPVVLTLG